MLPHTVLTPPKGSILDLDVGTLGEQRCKAPRTSESKPCKTRTSGPLSAVSSAKARPRNRADQPKVWYVDRASKEEAFSAAKSELSMSAALDELESDFHAASSKASRDSTLSTWLSFHDAWFGPETSPWPLTVQKLLVISAMFKKGKYKSFTNYLARAKEEHIVGGFEWTQVHDRVAKNCSRSVKRGLSGARRSDALDFDRAMVLCNKVGMNYTKPRAVFCPSALVALGVWFLCREIEIAGALANELEVDIIDMTVHFTFPVSKSDSEASGIRRSLGCLCAVTNHCPAHIAKTYLGALRRHFVTKLKMQWDTLPLFPTADGTAMSKDSVVRFLVSVVKGYGGRVVDEVSRPCISGHTFRISGARLLAKLGLDVISISLHGRWSSSAVLRYIADTPLESLSQRLVSNKPLCKELQALKNRVSELELGTLHARDESESASDSEDST